MSRNDDNGRRLAAKKSFKQVRKKFEEKKKGTSGKEAEKLLKKLGFRVESAGDAGHRVFFHDGLKDFYSASFNSGHKKSDPIKLPYMVNILKILDKHKDKIIDFMAKDDS